MSDEFRWYLLTKKRKEDLIVNAFRSLRSEGIEPILIKGWAAARNYPADKPRFYGDIDLAVSSADFKKATELVKDRSSGIGGVDLHCELRHLDTLDWKSLFDSSKLADLQGENIRMLCEEDHLRVLCVHWLTNGGEERERLWDIFYAVENRPANFDWDRCLGVVPLHRRGWIVSTIGLAHKYLGLDVSGLPFADQAKALPSWLTRCVESEWRRGVRSRPLHTALTDRRALIEQLRKRLPPNPIQATVDCEGFFDDRSRLLYQLRDIFRRLGPSISRVLPAFFVNRRERKQQA